jgi:hypothetical protein
MRSFKAKRSELEQTYSYMQESLVQAEFAILRRVAKPSQDAVEQARTVSQAQGNAVAPMDMNDLILLYMKHDLPTLRSSNPELTEADIQEIDKLIDLYLDLSVQNSQRKRVIGKMLDIEQFGSLSENDATLKLALQAFVSEAETKRHFDPANNRFLKVFEYHNGFYYRKNQIEKLQHLGVQLSGSNNEANLMESLVLEMMVGAGKTTYLLPTKGFWSANGERLSMAIMPEALIGNMSKEVERILGKTFAQKVKRFVFNRNTDLSPEHLESVLKMLKDAIEKKDYLITTDKSLKAFINQYAKVFKAALDAKAKFLAENTGRSRNLSQELMNLPEVVTAKLMTEILSVFKEKADVLCDEADLILDPRRELNFPEGEATSIPENYLSLSLQVYKFLLSPEIQEITSFEFSPNDQDACTPKIYEERVKPALVQKIIASLSQKEGTQSFKDLRTFYSTCSKDQKEMLENYFSGHDAEHAAENWIRGLQDDNIRQELGLLRGQLNVLLPLTLQKNYGERYGFHTDESILADPFSGSNNPNFGSQFSDPFERIDYTIQAYLKEPGMRRAVLEKLVHDLKTSAWKEMQENLEAIRKLPAGTEYKTAAHKEFERFFGQRKNLSLFSTKEVLIERLMDLLKEDPTAKFDLIEKYVLPQVKIYTQNLKSTSQSIGFLFTNPRGFTGTLWNKGTYHDSFNALFDDGARGQVVTLAYTQAKDKVSTVKIKKAKNLHKELIIDNPKYRHVKALIDAGGALKELDLKEVAEDWLKALTKQGSPIQGVVYFDKVTDQAYILERGESAPIPLTKSSCPIDKRVTIYDQKHTTGTDIKQAIDAVALVTVSKGMIIRDFIQAVGRMRQLASGQRIEIAVLEQDAVAIRELLKLDPKAELKIDDVLRFLIINEVRRQGEDNQVATTHKLTGVLQQWFLEKVLKASDFSEILTNFTHPELIEGLFFQTSEITPFKSYGQGTDLIDAKTAYAGKQESLISRLGLESICGSDSFLGSCLATVQNLMKTVIDLAELPSLVSGSPYAGDMEEEQEIMQEQETQQEQQQQQEELQDKDAGHTPWRHSQWTFLNSASVEKATIYEPTTVSANEWRRPTYAHFLKANDVMGSKIFDDAFELSHNFQLNGRVFQGSAVRPFGEFQKTIQNIIIVQNKKTKQFKVIAVEPHDAASFKKALQEKQKLKPTAKDPDLQAKPGHWYNYAKDYFSANNHGWTCLTGLDSNGRQSYYYDSCNRDAPDGESSEEWYHDANQDRWVQPKRVSKEGYSQGDDVSVWIGDLELNSLYESQDPIARADLESDKVARLLVQAKYFNGDVHYTDSQKKLLKQWLKDTKISAEALEQEFTKTIIAFNEQSKRDYPKSALYQIFAELKGTS